MDYLRNRVAKNRLGILFLALSGLWLLAPSLTPRLILGVNSISAYETAHANFSPLFRITDFFTAGLLLLVVMVSRRAIKDRWDKQVPTLLVFISGLMVLDILIPVKCSLSQGVCVIESSLVSTVHGIETVMLLVVIAMLSVYLVIKFKQHSWFILAQVLCLVLYILALVFDTHWLFAIQGGYELLLAFWLYELIFYSPTSSTRFSSQLIRSLLAIWIAVNGLISIVFTWRKISFGRISGSLFFASNPTWLLGHTILIGLALLYLARQLWLGEKRAMLLVNLLLVSEVLHFSITPDGWPFVMLFGLPLLVTIYNRQIFDRSGNFSGFRSRLKFILTGLLAGIVVIILATAAFRLHNHADWQASPIDTVRITKRVALLEISSDKDDSLRVKLFSRLITAVGAGVYVWIIVGIFLPASSFKDTNEVDAKELKLKLHRESSSSEDFFKLWPDDKNYYRTKAGSIIAYGSSGSVLLALANPIGQTEKQAKDVLEFLKYSRSHSFKSAWLMVEQDSKKTYEKAGYNLFQIGSSAVIEIKEFCESTLRSKWWRWQVNRGSRLGFTYKSLMPPYESELIKELKAVSDAWLERPGHREQTFAIGYFDANYLQNCRLHCLYDSTGSLIAFANELPIYKGKQTTVDMIRFLPGVDGAMQTLLASLLKQLYLEGKFTHFDLGLVPLAAIDSKAVKAIKQLAASRFSAEGLEQFKNKFEPDWQPNYLAYDGDPLDLAKIFLAVNKLMSQTN